MTSQKTRPVEPWKFFFRLNLFLISFVGILSTLMFWRFPPDLVLHPTFGAATLFGLVLTLGTFLIAVMTRAIVGSTRGGGLPYLTSFNAMLLMKTSAPVSQVIKKLAFILLVQALGFVIFAIFLRLLNRKPAKPAPSPLADAELDARSL